MEGPRSGDDESPDCEYHMTDQHSATNFYALKIRREEDLRNQRCQSED